MENILELQQVSKTFPKSNFTLENVTFSLPYGSILGFVGENGAGKTTTIGCILNTIAKDSGTVKLFGKEMTDADTDMREKIGVVYDGDNFPAYWTAAQLAKVMAGFYKQWDNILFQKFLKEYKLPANQKIKQYSRGMTMKLAIAVALSHHPQLPIDKVGINRLYLPKKRLAFEFIIFHGKEVAFVNPALFNDGAAFPYLSVLPCDFFLGAYPFVCFIIEHAACGYFDVRLRK